MLKGIWSGSLRQHATRLLGHKPEDLKDEVTFKLRYLTLTACTGAEPAALAALLDRRQMPDTMLYMCNRPVPPAEESSRELHKVVHDQIVGYEALAKELRIEVEEPARAAAVEKAMVLKPEALKLWIRYERMHDSMFHRSYNTLERPEAPQPEMEPEPDPAAPVESEADPAASAPPEPAVAEATTSGATFSEPAAGPVVTDEPAVERRSKRVATDEPVAPAPSAPIDAGRQAVADPDPDLADVPDQGTPAIVATASEFRLRIESRARRRENLEGLAPGPSRIPPEPPGEPPHVRVDAFGDAETPSRGAPASTDAAAPMNCRGDPEESPADHPDIDR
jgi:hypothetical protein